MEALPRTRSHTVTTVNGSPPPPSPLRLQRMAARTRTGSNLDADGARTLAAPAEATAAATEAESPTRDAGGRLRRALTGAGSSLVVGSNSPAAAAAAAAASSRARGASEASAALRTLSGASVAVALDVVSVVHTSGIQTRVGGPQALPSPLHLRRMQRQQPSSWHQPEALPLPESASDAEPANGPGATSDGSTAAAGQRQRRVPPPLARLAIPAPPAHMPLPAAAAASSLPLPQGAPDLAAPTRDTRPSPGGYVAAHSRADTDDDIDGLLDALRHF